jgi:hypothetical protein
VTSRDFVFLHFDSWLAFAAMIPIQRLDMLSFGGKDLRQQQCCYAIAGTAYRTEAKTCENALRYHYGFVSWDLIFVIFIYR